MILNSLNKNTLLIGKGLKTAVYFIIFAMSY
jgi:hypothetical protein